MSVCHTAALGLGEPGGYLALSGRAALLGRPLSIVYSSFLWVLSKFSSFIFQYCSDGEVVIETDRLQCCRF